MITLEQEILAIASRIFAIDDNTKLVKIPENLMEYTLFIPHPVQYKILEDPKPLETEWVQLSASVEPDFGFKYRMGFSRTHNILLISAQF